MRLTLKTTVVILLLLGFTGCGGPSDNIVKNIAAQYNISGAKASDIKIVKSYDKDGKTVMVLQIKNMVCEMPMLEIDGQWNATGIHCGG